METFNGRVDGIDVIGEGGEYKCFAFINDPSRYIQVITTSSRLQSVLESASVKNALVEVTYDEYKTTGEKILRRVRILDRK